MKLKKSLGQNFLHDTNIIADIVTASGTRKGDVVLEVGPGEGILTKGLLETGASIVSVEKDDRLISVLEEKFAKEIKLKQFTLIHADILDVDVKKIIKKPFKLVANIPYYITGQIIRMFLESKNQPESMTLLVQKEVAERIVAKDKKESLLSLSVKVSGEPKYVRTVSKGAFTPQPTVDSAVLHIENISKKRLAGVNEKVFFAILHAGFAHKRKQLLPNLSSLYTKENLIEAFDACDINIKSRAEDIAVEKWLKLCAKMSQ